MKSEWDIVVFHSGTHIVTRHKKYRPHYYVYAAPGRTRHETCEDLCGWLNGYIPRPPWFDDLTRESDEQVAHPNGLPITATGPSVESEPGKGDWTPDMDSASVAERKHMIDVLMQTQEQEAGDEA